MRNEEGGVPSVEGGLLSQEGEEITSTDGGKILNEKGGATGHGR